MVKAVKKPRHNGTPEEDRRDSALIDKVERETTTWIDYREKKAYKRRHVASKP
jgi:hypothetical protein